jgi:hypothetical protein
MGIRADTNKGLAKEIGQRVTRDAFLYFDPKSPEKQFAQCSTCRKYVPKKFLGASAPFDLCIEHGSKVEVGPGWSCGMYSVWPKGSPDAVVMRNHASELKPGLPGSVTPEESGLVDREVRCENCGFFQSAACKCGLYAALNLLLPRVFDLDSAVDEYGCCNANTEMA